MRYHRWQREAFVAAASLALVATIAGAGTAYANDPDSDDPPTLTIDGHTYGPEDGLQIDTESFVVSAGGGDIGVVFEDPNDEGTAGRTSWGSSYAYSTEILQLGYQGYAKAGANVYSGLRIVEVCFWYTRGGVRLTPTTCSDAYFNGGWNAGAEVQRGVDDTLDPWAPQTVFNISTARIDPSAHS